MPQRDFEELKVRLGDRVRALRQERGWTQEVAAAASGIHLRHWQKVEAGEVNVTLDSLHRIAGALDVEVDQLLTRR